MAELECHRVWLAIDRQQSRSDEHYNIRLTDVAGNNASIACGPLERSQQMAGEPHLSWDDFLSRYTDDDVSSAAVERFGRTLFNRLIGDAGLRETWQSIRTVADGRPLSLEVEFGRGTEVFSSLPLELLRDQYGFVFATPGSGLLRILRDTPSVMRDHPPHPRVLFAWACPQYAGDFFDPKPHETILYERFGEQLTVLPNVTRDQLQNELVQAVDTGQPYDYLHLLAHGVDGGGAITLCGSGGGPDPVTAQQLGAIVQGVQPASRAPFRRPAAESCRDHWRPVADRGAEFRAGHGSA